MTPGGPESKCVTRDHHRGNSDVPTTQPRSPEPGSPSCPHSTGCGSGEGRPPQLCQDPR